MLVNHYCIIHYAISLDSGHDQTRASSTTVMLLSLQDVSHHGNFTDQEKKDAAPQ